MSGRAVEVGLIGEVQFEGRRALLFKEVRVIAGNLAETDLYVDVLTGLLVKREELPTASHPISLPC
jgi:hypothetical protein